MAARPQNSRTVTPDLARLERNAEFEVGIGSVPLGGSPKMENPKEGGVEGSGRKEGRGGGGGEKGRGKGEGGRGEKSIHKPQSHSKLDHVKVGKHLCCNVP